MRFNSTLLKDGLCIMTSFQEYNMEKWWKESNFIVEEPDYFKLVIWVNINSDDTY